MSRFILIPFDFHEASYYSLILCKQESGCTEYRITIMNGDLEKMLLGNNLVTEVDGCVHVEISNNEQQERLKMVIVKSLVAFLRVPLKQSFSND